jgi:hypothetical protein
MKESELCPMCSFDYQVCIAISELASKYGLAARGSVIPDLKGSYKIRFTASPKKFSNPRK